MYIKSFAMEPYAVNSHLAWTKTGEAVVVDCGNEPERVLAELRQRELRLTAVLLTHLHVDHVMGVGRLCRATEAAALGPEADAFLLTGREDAFRLTPVLPGRQHFLGEPCLVLPVPGHTPGHLAYFFPQSLTVFTGDTLFAGSVGRTDSPGGDGPLLLASIRKRLLCLPDAVEIFPGHGPSTTVGREKARNPFFADGFHTP